MRPTTVCSHSRPRLIDISSLFTSLRPDRDERHGAHRSNPGWWLINAYRPEGRLKPRKGAALVKKKPLRARCAAAPFSPPVHLAAARFLRTRCPTRPRELSRDSVPDGIGRVSAGGSTAGVLLKKTSIKPTLIPDARALQTFDCTTLIRRSGAQSFKNFCISLACPAVTGQGEASVLAMVRKKVDFC